MKPPFALHREGSPSTPWCCDAAMGTTYRGHAKTRFANRAKPRLSADHAKSAFHAPGRDTPPTRGVHVAFGSVIRGEGAL
jgi:hypothetical protein